MLDVRRGDRGPRVVVLQVLLNRACGLGLKLDGIFGRHTSNAVQAARQQMLGGPGADADPDLWMALLEEEPSQHRWPYCEAGAMATMGVG